MGDIYGDIMGRYYEEEWMYKWWKSTFSQHSPLDFHHLYFNLLGKTQWDKNLGSNIYNYLLDLVMVDILKTISLKTLSGKPSGIKPDRREKEYSAQMSAQNFAPLDCLVKNLVRKTQWDKT